MVEVVPTPTVPTPITPKSVVDPADTNLFLKCLSKKKFNSYPFNDGSET